MPARSASPLLRAAGQAYGRVQLLRALPLLIGKGRNPFGDGDVARDPCRRCCSKPRSELAQARQLATAAPATMLPAILPLALVEPYLAALERTWLSRRRRAGGHFCTHPRLATVEGERARAGLVPRDGG